MPRDLFAESGIDPKAQTGPRDLFAENGITAGSSDIPVQPSASKALADAAAASFFAGGAGLTEDVADIGTYIGKKTGISKITDFLGVPDILRPAAKKVKERAAMLSNYAEKYGAGPATKFAGGVVGGAIPGIAEFMAGTVAAGLKGAATAEKEGTSQLLGAAKSASERFLMGKLFDGITIGGKFYKGISDLPLAKRALAMGATFGGQAVADPLMAGKPVEPSDVASAIGTGLVYSLAGGRKKPVIPSIVSGFEGPTEVQGPSWPGQPALPPGEGGASWGQSTRGPGEPPTGPEGGPAALPGGATALPGPEPTYEPGSPNYSILDRLPGAGPHVKRAIESLNIGDIKDIPINPSVAGSPAAQPSPEAAPESSLQQGVEAATPPQRALSPGAATEAGISRHRLEQVLRDQGIMPGTPEYENILQEHRQVAREYDRVTGFQPGDYLDKAMDRIKKSGEDSSYGAIDLRNLGGLNEHFGGEEKANKAVEEISGLIKSTVDSIVGKHVQWFRKGGDEFTVIAEGIPKKTLDAALVKASDAVESYAQEQGLSEIKHPKGKIPGVGIHFGTSDFSPKTTRETITNAEDMLYQKKKEAGRAETIRRNKEIVPETGKAAQGGEAAGGNDVYRPFQESEQGGEVTPQGQEEKGGSVDRGLLEPTTGLNSSRFPPKDVPVKDIHLSEDVPNFKEDADEKTGVVKGQEIQAKEYEELGTAPIVLWERLNGRLEVITGRHRLDLARRLGKEDISSQIVREADGFTKQHTITFDAEANIRDGQGRTEDYAHYFKHSPQLTEEEARTRGLLGRSKGKAGFDLGRLASDDVYGLWRNGQINKDQALAIARTAPNNDAAQEIGSKYAREGKSANYVSNLMRVAVMNSGGNEKNLDLFGHDDSALKDAEAQAKRAVSIQREIKDQISAVSGASKRPEAARKLGVDIKDPAAVQAKVAELKAEAGRWDNWPAHPDLVDRVREESPKETQGGLQLNAFPAGIIEALKPLVKDVKAAMPHLVELGKGVMAKGATTYQKFVEGMKQHLGDMWQSFKSAMVRVWQTVKSWNEKLGERGATEARTSFGKGGKEHGPEKPSEGKAPNEEVREEKTEARVRSTINEAKARVDEFAKKADEFTDKSEFMKQDVKPISEAVGTGFRSVVDGFKRMFNPMSRSKDAEEAGRILIERMGITQQMTGAFKAKLDRLTEKYTKATTWLGRTLDVMQTSSGLATDRIFNRMTKEEKQAFMQAMDAGTQQPRPELQVIADSIKEMFDAKVKAVQDLGTGLLKNVRESYFPHIWKTKLTEAQIAEMMSKRPIEGSKAFSKERIFDDVQEGLDKGYEPISENPLDLVFLKMHEMDKYINAHTALQEMKSHGLAKVIPAGDQVPRGWQNVQQPYGLTSYVEGRGGKMRYIVREDVGQVINNYLSTNLYNNKYAGGIFKTYMGAANSLNRFQLGVFSGFHAAFISMDAIVSHGSLGIKALAKGDYRQAGAYFREAPAAAVNGIKNGEQIMKAWYGNPDAGKEMPQMVQWLQMAGARKEMDSRFLGNSTQRMMEAWANGNKVGAAIRTPFALVEQSARPILEYLVPRQKFSVFGEMANAWSEANPGASHEEIRTAMQKIWNRVDSRMGQVVYDRMFVHNVAKNVMQAGLRAPGWTGGTIVELGGGITDFGKQLNNIFQGKKVEMTDRMAYTLSLAITTAITNGLLTKAFTGDDPKDKDFLAFRTGGQDEQGNPERFMWPTYGKDAYAYVTAPGKALLNKTNPLLSLAGEYKQNKDYYGVEIRHPGDNSLLQAGDVIWHGVKAYVPFWMRATSQANKRGDNLPSMIAPLVGIMPASSEYTKTEAQKEASEFLRARTPAAARTREEYNRRQEKYKIEQKFRHGDPEASALMQQSVSEGKITTQDAKDIMHTKGSTPLQVNFKRLSPDEALVVYQDANAEEKKTLSPMLAKKIRDSRAVPGKKSEWMTAFRSIQGGE